MEITQVYHGSMRKCRPTLLVILQVVAKQVREERIM